MMKDDDLLTVAEVAGLKGVTTQSVYRWIEAGLRVQERRVVGKRRHKVISQRDLDYFLDLGVR